MKTLWVMLIILLVASALRIRAITWGYPYLLDGDEFRLIYNGLSFYYTGEQRDTVNANMGTYPPFKGWEVALTRAGLVLLLGDNITPGVQMLFSRFFTLAYGLLITGLLYKIGRGLGKNPGAGVLAAAFFATWTSLQPREARLALADMPALFFFTLTLYASLNTYRKGALNWLAAGWVCGLLAGLAKYNMATVLLLPALLTLYELRRRFIVALTEALLPAFFIGLPLVALFGITIDLPGILYDYLNPKAAAQYVELQSSYGVRLTENSQLQYASHAAGIEGRLRQNASLLFHYLPVWMVGLAIWGGLWAWWHGEGGFIFLLGLLAVCTFGAISLFRALGERQLLGVMVILILLAGYGLTSPPSPLSAGREGALNCVPLRGMIVVVICLFFVWQAHIAWERASAVKIPDSRVAVVEWLVKNAPSGSRIASESYLFELGELNGYRSPKRFEVYQTPSLTRLPPAWWACLGIRYLVAHQYFEVIGGYYGSPVPLGWSVYVQPVVEFHSPEYTYAQQTIFQVLPSGVLCDGWWGRLWREAHWGQPPIEP